MIIAVILCFIINSINKALVKLEYKQEVLAYDMYILDKKIKEEEYLLLN